MEVDLSTGSQEGSCIDRELGPRVTLLNKTTAGQRLKRVTLWRRAISPTGNFQHGCLVQPQIWGTLLAQFIYDFFLCAKLSWRVRLWQCIGWVVELVT